MYKPIQLPDGPSAPGSGPYISETQKNKLSTRCTQSNVDRSYDNAIFKKKKKEE